MAIPIFSQKSNRWREYYNPLRGLSLPKLVGLLESGERGQNADLQWMYYYMERSDPMIFSILQRRRAALTWRAAAAMPCRCYPKGSVWLPAHTPGHITCDCRSSV